MRQIDGIKLCTRCGEKKPVELFGKNSSTVDGFFQWCKSCCKEFKTLAHARKKAAMSAEDVRELTKEKVCKHCGETRSSSDFGLSWSAKDCLSNQCKSCKESMRLLREATVTQETIDRRRAMSRTAKLKREFGITDDDYDEMLEFQCGVCAICGSRSDSRPRNENLHVDHDHWTGMVRGLLCSDCNLGIGNLRDDTDILRKAIEYLMVPTTELMRRDKYREVA